MKNILYINDLEFFAYHGVFLEEKKLGQKFIISGEFSLDFSSAMLTDDINLSVSYADIANCIKETTTKKSYNLLEKLAYEILKNIFTTFKNISSITLKINKPNAPMQKIFRECGVSVEYSRKDFYERFKL